MGRYLLRRFWGSLITVVLFATVMFFLVQIIIPHDFTVQFSLGMTRGEREAMAEELGLNRPLWQQYLDWMVNLFTGQFGDSFYGYPVMELIKSALPISLIIFLPGTALAFLIGFWLGKFTGWRGEGLVTTSTTFGAMALYTSFPPWIAFLITYFLARKLKMFRPVFANAGFSGLDHTIWSGGVMTPESIASRMVISLVAGTLIFVLVSRVLKWRFHRSLPLSLGIPIILALAAGSWYLLGIERQSWDLLRRSLLPMLTYTALSFGETMLIMRTSLTDTLHEEYVVVARAKGLPERLVRDKHAVRNAILPVASRLIITLPYLMTGVVIIEDVLEWPGVGRALWSSLYQQDMPVVMALLLFIGLLTLISRLLLDIVIAVLDPRIRFEQAEPELA